MCSVYPLTHTNTSQAIKYLHESLETFIQAYGELSIEVKKDQLNYTDAVCFKVPPGTANQRIFFSGTESAGCHSWKAFSLKKSRHLSGCLTSIEIFPQKLKMIW